MFTCIKQSTFYLYSNNDQFLSKFHEDRVILKRMVPDEYYLFISNGYIGLEIIAIAVVDAIDVNSV